MNQANSQPGARVKIVGAGFSGLTTAYYLQRAGFEVELFEQSHRVGGLIQTHQQPDGRVETAANGLLNSVLVEALFRDLQLPLVATMKTARRRFIFRGGAARRWPLSFFESMRLLFLLPRLIFARETLAPRQRESVASWGRRLLGPTGSLFTVETALQGIYAGDSERMSASLILGRLFGLPAIGPVWKKPASGPVTLGTVTAPLGLQQLLDSLSHLLIRRGARISLGEPITAAQVAAWAERMPVVLATSAPEALRLLKGNGPAAPDRAADFSDSGETGVAGERRLLALASIEMLPLVTSTVFFEKPLGPRGFGCLFPPSRSARPLGVLLNNFIFPSAVRNGFSETWMIGGALFRFADPPSAVAGSSIQYSRVSGEDARSGRQVGPSDPTTLSDQAILQMIESARQSEFGVESAIRGFQITRWPAALPHYTVDLEARIADLQDIQGNILLMGNYLGQIGLAKLLERASGIPGYLKERGYWSDEKPI